MKINFSKRMVITSSEKGIVLEDKNLETVGGFCFLLSIVPSTDIDVSQCITLVSAGFGRLINGIFSNRSISTSLKARLYGAIILPIVIYGAEVGRYDHRRYNLLRFLRCTAFRLLKVLPGRTDYKISRSDRTP